MEISQNTEPSDWAELPDNDPEHAPNPEYRAALDASLKRLLDRGTQPVY